MIVEYLSDNEKLVDEINNIDKDAWPVFLTKDTIVKKHWKSLYTKYQEYQLLLKIEDEYVGVGNSVPIYWNEKIDGLPIGFDEVLENVFKDNRKRNTLCGLAAITSKNHLGKGISYKIIDEFKKLAKTKGFSNLILPVRPTLKSKYPTISMKNYIKWEKNALPFDPWIRVHIKSGGKILKIANPSMTITGTIADWEKWTDMYFGESGQYIIPGALNPVTINLEKNTGKYIEPNVWILHKC
ncbi:MAG: hypothetical protein KAT68_05925 [Bacteroidales bacterium]|nr:hypothetical protein [Bacteroidales bacterium]